MFTPNAKMMKINYTIDNGGSYVDTAILVWSPALACEVWLDSEDLFENYDMERTTEKPKPYTGSCSLNQDWVILTSNDDSKRIFWTDADQFTFESVEDLSFCDNAGLDIDVDSIAFDYSDGITFTNDEGNTWDVGMVDDITEGKVTLYSAVESNEATGEDVDGDDIFGQIPQEKFEAIRQLFIQAGFKVKMKRYPRDRR